MRDLSGAVNDKGSCDFLLLNTILFTTLLATQLANVTEIRSTLTFKCRLNKFRSPVYLMPVYLKLSLHLKLAKQILQNPIKTKNNKIEC